MAYRFLLEVPEKMSGDANVAVSSTDDAQVILGRAAHGLGFDEPYTNLTVAAHSLKVVNTIYQWANEIGATRPDTRFHVGVVLHSGQRIGLHETDARGMVAAIRRDQPWVETSMPKIGEHERELVAGPGSVAAARRGAIATLEQPATSPITAVNLIDADDELTIRGRTYAVIQVNDLAPAERLYHEVLGLSLVQRMRQDEDGAWEELGTGYDHFTASRDSTEADVAFMSSGPLNIALMRAGRAARLDDASVSNEIAFRTDMTTAAKLKALVLMRNYTLLTSTGPAFSFRDPFGVVWHVHPDQ
jgi:catechol 2,3-dioxygenase-like lactoylglutathione lyase family enzyme